MTMEGSTLRHGAGNGDDQMAQAPPALRQAAGPLGKHTPELSERRSLTRR